MSKILFSLREKIERIDFKSIYVGLFFLVLIIIMQGLLIDYIYRPELSSFNNYLIFKSSFFHLMGGLDLYVLYPMEYLDLFKYSPTFAFLMAPFSVLPNALGLLLWNILNVFVFFKGLESLPNLTPLQKKLTLIFVLIELITSIQNHQSNALIAGFLLLAFSCLESKRFFWAMGLIVGSGFIKIFGLAMLCLYVFYPNKLRHLIYGIFWVLFLFMLPLPWIDFSDLLMHYKGWFTLLSNDHSSSFGLSVVGWFYTWFGIEAKKELLIVGVVFALLPLIQFRRFECFNFRFLYLCSMLVWIVIFNHKAESPTFVIALTGVSLWYVKQGLNSKLDTLLFVLTFVFASLSPTDLFPKYLRENWIVPFVLKGVVCIFVWCKIIFDLLVFKQSEISGFKHKMEEV